MALLPGLCREARQREARTRAAQFQNGTATDPGTALDPGTGANSLHAGPRPIGSP
jgi:hypothetical protein